MANKLKVDELRDELAQRGHSTTGTKPTLVRRLESAIRKENKQSNDSINVSESKKRHRVSGDGDSNGAEKIKAIDKFRDMGIKQLREQATLRGIFTNGSKKQLLETLCADSKKDNLEGREDKDEDERKEKLVTATKKGAAVLDQWLPDHIKAHYHVLKQDDEIYDAMLNQTNVGENNNKFYVIQVLESDDGGRFVVYNRWGRVGIRGQDKLHGPFTSWESAIQEFEQKFYAKTKNHWSNRKEFVCHPKSYTWLEMDYTEKEEESDVQGKSNSTMGIQPRETKLEARVAKFISLICNVSMMKQHMMEIGYNAEKLPLGKLSKSTILKGYDVLKRIADVIGQSQRKKLEQLSGEFYTVIPHDFGFKKMREFVIDTPQKLKRKLEMVEALGEIELATKLLTDAIGMQEDPLYSHYERLHCELMPLEVDSKEFSMIAKYMKNTHARTHSNYTVEVVQIFRVSKEGEGERFRKFSNTKNRMLLWHGSRLTNWTGILSQGLRIAPPEAPVTGYMFGKGVYFADMFSKSANYCYSTHATTAGVLLLCEVALGDMAELLTADYNADKLPEGKLSTKGVGSTAPDFAEVQTLEDGVVVPLGKSKEQLAPKGSLLYNEYIVYNVDQIRMRYVVQVNFNFKR
ncbi:poly [ADP-ribose] polymerase 2 [Cornus florida]|uniref:poly [ADP-ribose] polymerase 2 n=1 Tax=Cornus florida TaxID=4283 RepID=UPI0028A0A04F|nr:poly [ADP-ribose] polymerase 2 [Cornus florida]